MAGATVSKNTEKIGLGEKVAFCMVNLGNIPVQALLNSFLMIFYTDVVGLNPAAIATLFLLARVIDGINDPIMGFIIDHLPRTKLGRFRSYLILGTVICCINYILVWFGPVWIPVGKLAVAYISYLLLGITFDLMDIPLNSILPCMTDIGKERNILSSIKGFSYMAGMRLFSMAAPLILAAAVTPLSGYYALIFSAVGIIIVLSVIGAMGIHERIEPVNKEEKYKLKDIIPILGSRPVLITFIATIISSTAQATANGSNIFFITYILNRRFDVMSRSFLFSLLGMLPVMLIMPFLANRFGKKTIYLVGLAFSGIFPLTRLFALTNIPLIYAATTFGGVGGGLAMALRYGIQADNVDYVEYERKQRAEGAIAAIQSFVMKAGMGIGGAIPGYILAATGYMPNQPQTDSAKTGIVASVIVIPACVFLASLLVFGLGYNINKERLAEITSSLREARAAKAKRAK